MAKVGIVMGSDSDLSVMRNMLLITTMAYAKGIFRFKIMTDYDTFASKKHKYQHNLIRQDYEKADDDTCYGFDGWMLLGHEHFKDSQFNIFL